MEQNLWERSREITAMLRSEIERRSLDDEADRGAIARAVLNELTPPGWRYQLYLPADTEYPDFLLVPAAFAG
ncbi:MAG: hypothetical protein JWR00_856 [Rubritepida sp.]|nr:hypothetical protein [Rubritepida sp.]